MKKIVLLMFLTAGLLSCKSRLHSALNKDINKAIVNDFYDTQFTGVFVFDPKTKDTLYKHHSSKYFTPASNTKIITLYAALKILPDSVPALKYSIVDNTLFLEGTGDPTFLHPYFMDSTALNFISGYEKVRLHLNNFNETHFGPGWAWEDYDTYFSPERSGFPMYGNVVEISKTEELKVSPSLLKDKVTINIAAPKRRAFNDNVFYYNRRQDTIQIPMVMDSTLIKAIWNDIAPNRVALVNKMPNKEKTVLYGIPSDSLYKRMMLESDNFLAEQMLVLASSLISDTLISSKIRNLVLNDYLKTMKHPPRWVDGSGLSRYNLFTPESLVHVLNTMYSEFPRDRLFNLFPTMSISGSTENRKPHMYAKSGSLGNNYNLSGYLITKSGKTLIFSFMNNHFKQRTSEVKQRVLNILEHIRNTY